MCGVKPELGVPTLQGRWGWQPPGLVISPMELTWICAVMVPGPWNVGASWRLIPGLLDPGIVLEGEPLDIF